MNRNAKRKAAQTRRNVVLIVALMLVVCVASIGGTIAWLTDTTENVVNTFSPSNINIELTEDGAVEGKKSYDMVPGVVLDKKPLVTVKADSEDCWVFVKVTETCGVEGYEFDEFITYGVNPVNWTELNDGVYYCIAQNITDDRSISVIGYQNGDEFIKDQVLVNTDVTKEMMDALENAVADVYLTLSFEAYAIQLSGFEPTDFNDANAVKTAAQKAWNKINDSMTSGN